MTLLIKEDNDLFVEQDEEPKISNPTVTRELLLKALLTHEALPKEAGICIIQNCQNRGLIDCPDCDAPGLICNNAVESHRRIPFHRPRRWSGEF